MDEREETNRNILELNEQLDSQLPNDEVDKESDEVQMDSQNPPNFVKDIAFEIVNCQEEEDSASLDRDAFSALMDRFILIEQQLNQLSFEFQSKLKYDTHKDKVIDNLHTELQTYKNGLTDKLLRPIFMDIIEIIDDNKRLIKDLKARGDDGNPEKIWKLLETIPDDLEDMLYKHGVDVMRSEDGIFNPSLQKAMKILATDDEAFDKRISERLKNGYTWEGRLLRQEVVSVWKFQK